MAKVLGSWTGDTVMVRGRRHFELNGVLVPADTAVQFKDSLWQRVRRWVVPRPNFNPTPLGSESGGIQGWQEALDSTTADGTQISNSAVETIVCPDFNIPAYYMALGRTLRVWTFGVMSNVVTTPGTYTHSIRWGGVSGTVLAKTAAQSLDTSAHTNALWYSLNYITVRSVGASGTFLTGGIFGAFNLLSSSAANLLPALMGSAGTPGSSGSAAVTVDTTTAKLLSVTGTFSVNTNPTNLTCQQRIIEALN